MIAACEKPRLVSRELSVGSRSDLKDPLGVESAHSRAALRDAPHVVALERGDLLFYCRLTFRALRAGHGLYIAKLIALICYANHLIARISFLLACNRLLAL